MEKTTRIVIETKNFRFGYERKIVKPEPKKPAQLEQVNGKYVDIRV